MRHFFFPCANRGASLVHAHVCRKGGKITGHGVSMHVHLLDFNEHVHSEDSMPRSAHMHFQKTHVSFPQKKFQVKKESKRND